MFSWWGCIIKVRSKLLLGLLLIIFSQVALAKMPLDLVNNDIAIIEEFADVSFAVPWYEKLPEFTAHNLFVVGVSFFDSLGLVDDEDPLYGEMPSFISNL